MPVVQMEDGTELEFPESMSREHMRSVILSKYPALDEPSETEKAAKSLAETRDLVESSRVARGTVTTIGPNTFTDRLKRCIFPAPGPQTSAELLTGKPGV